MKSYCKSNEPLSYALNVELSKRASEEIEETKAPRKNRHRT